tara:strand:+ start:599 stop:850 length:252 start_codon:yes stop_codon:yes gene_type:complete
MDYEELEYLLDAYYANYQVMNVRDRAFEQATQWLYEGIDEAYSESEMVELIRDVRNDPFQNASGSTKSLLDNLLSEFLDEVSF